MLKPKFKQKNTFKNKKYLKEKSLKTKNTLRLLGCLFRFVRNIDSEIKVVIKYFVCLKKVVKFKIRKSSCFSFLASWDSWIDFWLCREGKSVRFCGSVDGTINSFSLEAAVVSS